MPFLHKNVSTEVAKTYTFVTEVIRNTVEMARSIAEVISIQRICYPHVDDKNTKNLGVF